MNTTSPTRRGLLSELGSDVSSLFRKEVQLAKTEASEKLSQAGVGLGAIVSGVVLALGALIVLLQALVIGLTNAGLGAGWSALIVGVAVALIAFVLMQKGVSDLKARNLAPGRTLASLQRDSQTIRERTVKEHTHE